MKVERSQVEEVSVTYCDSDLRDMLRYEDSDGESKPIPEDATLQIVDGGLRVRFFQERTITNEIPGARIVEPVEEVSRFKYTREDVAAMLKYGAKGARALDIYCILMRADEPMTSKDIRASLTPEVGLAHLRRSINALEQANVIEYCGARYPQVRDNKRLRRMHSWRPKRRSEGSVTSG